MCLRISCQTYVNILLDKSDYNLTKILLIASVAHRSSMTLLHVFRLIFGRPFQNGRPMLSDRCPVCSVLSCPVCLSGCLAVPLILSGGEAGSPTDHGPTDMGQVSAHVRCGQTAGWIKLPLGTEVGLIPRYIVLDGDPAPPERGTTAPLFSAHVYCGQALVMVKFHYAILVADCRSEAGRMRPAASWNLAYHLAS